mmetsp:Transcript_35524/g.93872  ORF Transcript_35524/g.93872 Transcript_35524/m.93872 type:complete len:107 (-) Transcript_35524:994-1314(-)
MPHNLLGCHGENIQARQVVQTPWAWPENCAIHVALSVLQILEVPSAEDVTTNAPSSKKKAVVTGSEWLKVASSLPVWTSQTLAVPSREAVNTFLPLGENTAEATAS